MDDVKRAIFKTILTTNRQTNGLNTDTKSALNKLYQQIVSLRKQSNVIITRDVLSSSASIISQNSSTDDKHSNNENGGEGSDHETGGKRQRHVKKNRRGSDRKRKGGNDDAMDLEKQLKYLQSAVSR